MNETEMQKVLEDLSALQDDAQARQRRHRGIWKEAHPLAEAQYLPARDFFVAGLDDEQWVWRDDCLKCLGFHYQFEADSAIADKVRQLLRADAAAEVRLTAASVLAGRSQWPDQALISALKEDPDRYVQQAAFEALLRLAGYSMLEVRQIVRGLQESGSALDWEEFRHVVANKGLQVPLE